MTHIHSILKRYAILSLATLGIIELFLVPLDVGRYSQTVQDFGIVGFLGLHSVLAVQIWFLLSVIFLVAFSFRNSYGLALRVLASLLAVAVGIYVLSIYLIHEASLSGEFGIGAAGFVGMFGFLPSAFTLVLGVPLTLILAIRKSCAGAPEPTPG